MRRDGPLTHLWIIGPGRLGLALGAQLARTGRLGALTYSGRSANSPEHSLFATGAARYVQFERLPNPPPSTVVLAVPDGAIASVTRRLSELLVPPVVVLHTSGALGADILAPLATQGAAIGSIHPLAAMPDGPSGGERLVGGWFAIEGNGEAVAAAESIAYALDGKVLRIAAGSKALYHAAAVFASNYLVVLLAAGERLMEQAGVPPEVALAALTDLARGAVANVAALGPVEALTGPVSRGDVGTLELHLRGLSASDRSLYSVLAREALALARLQGLGRAGADQIADLLEPGTP